MTNAGETLAAIGFLALMVSMIALMSFGAIILEPGVCP